MRNINLLLFVILCFSTAFGAETNDFQNKMSTLQRIDVSGIDSIGDLDTFRVDPNEVIDFILTDKMDSMMNSWYISNAFGLNKENPVDSIFTSIIESGGPNSPYTTKNIPDSVFIERLKSINSAIDLSYNPTIRNTIAFYAERRREKVEVLLGLSKYYLPMIEEIFDKYNLPIELKYMAVIESAFNPKAFSRAGASGIWQFMYGTGKLYKLEVNSFVDERRDPVKSTEAAARYLRDLYKIYNDWHLVIAAYNCGPGNINKAIKRSGDKHNYWDIYYRLPKETRGYVPAFIAAAYIMNYYKLHDYFPRVPTFSLSTDTITIKNYLNLKQVSQQLNLDIEMLRDINPMYRRDIIPGTATKPYPLVLPIDAINKYIAMEAQILANKRDEYFPNNQIKNPSQLTNSNPPIDIKGKDHVYYTVKSGDNLGFIGDWFNVKPSDIRYWNNIDGNRIKEGQNLDIYVSPGKGSYYNGFNTMTFTQKQKEVGAIVRLEPTASKAVAPPVSASSTAASTSDQTDGSYQYYTVRRGDNPWTIAKKFPGVTAESILKLNGISNTRGLDIGQKLKIKKI